MMQFKIHVIDVKNQLQNYIWLIEHQQSHNVVAIDPTEASLVEDYCKEQQLNLEQIWLTHWHKDHIGGVPELIANRNIPVYAPREELSHIPFITHPLQHDDQFEFHGVKIDIIAVPGHTLGHIVYFIDALDSVFCGDTLLLWVAVACLKERQNSFIIRSIALQRSHQELKCIAPMNILFQMHNLLYTLNLRIAPFNNEQKKLDS